jgi:hypothetical protein
MVSALAPGDFLADDRLLGSNQAIACTRLHQAAPPAVHRQFRTATSGRSIEVVCVYVGLAGGRHEIPRGDEGTAHREAAF